MKFTIKSPWGLKGDQKQAVEKLSSGIEEGKRAQVLLGITGSGKTFTIANIIQKTQKPALILAHNKTLAAQLYQEFAMLFPNNAVEYFVSYYDYYQPEAYVARSDTYIEKDLAINEHIDKLRLRATCALLERKDVIIISSVSCIYGLGMPEHFAQLKLSLMQKQRIQRDEILRHLVELQYVRNDLQLSRGKFRVRGDVIDIIPSYHDDLAYRITLFGDEIEKIIEIDPLTGQKQKDLPSLSIYPSSHHVTPQSARIAALETIREELKERTAFFEKSNQLIEKQRIKERTIYDLELIQEIGHCKGIENYSRHFSQRKPGSPPACLLNYFPKDYLLFIDESHQTLPQIRAMHNGDRARKKSLIDFGFRLPSAYDNRPLTFDEFYENINQVIYVSATPGEFELRESQGEIVEQIIRPTGLLDPKIEVRPATTQVDDALEEIRIEKEKGGRILVTTLTKKLAEDLAKYLQDIGVKAKYLHSDIDTLERVKIIRELRQGIFDVLVGINLLREGLDIPEVSLVTILDADKEGFLRSQTALIQTCGRAARNANGRVILYGDKVTQSMKNTIEITQKRREIQKEFNDIHKITPQTIVKEIRENLAIGDEEKKNPKNKRNKSKGDLPETLDQNSLLKKINEIEKKMHIAAKNYHFEEAAKLRDLRNHYKNLLIQA